MSNKPDAASPKEPPAPPPSPADNHHDDDDDDCRMMEDDYDFQDPQQQQRQQQQQQQPPLVLSPEFQFPLRSRVVIRGLKHNPRLNHHLAIVEEFLWEQGRYKLRPLSRAAKRVTKSKYVSILPKNLHLVPPSAFVAKITIDNNNNNKATGATTIRVPLICHVTLFDNNNNNNNMMMEEEEEEEDPSQQQLCVQLKYADFLGIDVQTKAKESLPTLLSVNSTTHHDDDVFGVLNTPINYDEHLLPDQYLDSIGDELLIVYPKRTIGALYEAMIDYELLEELETSVHVGLHGSLPLCRLRFPYHVSAPAAAVVPNNNNANEEEDESPPPKKGAEPTTEAKEGQETPPTTTSSSLNKRQRGE